MCSSYSFSTSALDGGEWSASCPDCALPLGEASPVPTGQVGPRADLDTEVTGKILLPLPASNLDCPVVQSVVRHYTDSATPAPLYLQPYIYYTKGLHTELEGHTVSLLLVTKLVLAT
jgi:hypothetical protein